MLIESTGWAGVSVVANLLSLGLSMHGPCALVVPHADKLRVSQQSVPCPFYERDLDDLRGFHPLQRRHVVGSDTCTPATSTSTIRQVDKWTARQVRSSQAPVDLGSKIGCKACTDLRGEVQLPSFVVSDEDRIEVRPARLEAPHDELLLGAEFHLDPGIGPLTGVVRRIAPFGDDALE